VAHAAFETYSVLTRLPDEVRAAPDTVWAFLDDWFETRWLALAADAQREGLKRLRDAGVSGGPTYDGVIALTAAAARATLVTCDRRALPTYLRLGAEVELVS
jgi:predicted nucleic acid-binding protein